MSTTINPPDFDDMMEISEEIRKLSIRKMELYNKIKELESEMYEKATNDTEYYINGKPPSVSYIKSAWEYRGLNGELIALRDALGRIEIDLDYEKRLFDLKKDMLEVWRTESANKRASVL